ncbi:MAG TPA: SH3 domain-containing protein [Burkholderiales bacterium]|nr:SH3 domain-containing protein [Burkholderiales bacterium]
MALAWSAVAGDFRSVAENGTPMYDAPSVRAKKLFVASRLYPVEIVINIDNWVKVRDQAGDLAWVERKTLSEKRTVIVTAAVADVRQTASDQSAVVFQAQQGVALDVAEPPTGGWVRVRHAEGQSGYIKIGQVWGV